MLRDGLAAGHIGAQVTAASGAVLSAEDVADVGGRGARRGAVPDPAAPRGRHVPRCTGPSDPDRWLAGMRRLAAAGAAR